MNLTELLRGLSVPLGLEPPQGSSLSQVSAGLHYGGKRTKTEIEHTHDDPIDMLDTDLCAEGVCDDLIYQALLLKMTEPTIDLEHIDRDELLRTIRDEFDSASSAYQISLADVDRELPRNDKTDTQKSSKSSKSSSTSTISLRLSKKKGTRRTKNGRPTQGIRLRVSAKKGRR